MKHAKTALVLLLGMVILFSFTACKDDGKSAPAYTLSKTEITLKTDTDTTLELTREGITITEGVDWKSSDPKIATVTNGKVTAKKVGTCTVTASLDGSDYVCTVTVVAENHYALDIAEMILEKGKTHQLVLTNNGEPSTDKVIWESENTAIVTVKDGLVTAAGEGTAKVFAKIGDRSYECTVTVRPQYVGEFRAEKKAMGITLVFDLSLKADGTFTYERVDEPNQIASGTFVVNYDNNTVTLLYGDSKQIGLEIVSGDQLKSKGKMVTGGMETELEFARKTA